MKMPKEYIKPEMYTEDIRMTFFQSCCTGQEPAGNFPPYMTNPMCVGCSWQPATDYPAT